MATSTGLYLVGSVYTDAYYGRMSIEVTALDLAPPFIALQSTHVLGSLLAYPMSLLFFYMLYRVVSSRVLWARTLYERAHQRFGRFFLLIVNLIIVSPLAAAAFWGTFNDGLTNPSSVLSEVISLMGTVGLLLLVYVIWLSFGPREIIIVQIRQRKIIPIALLAVLYLLDALVATADGATVDAELLMTGAADNSIEIAFTMADGVRNTLPDSDLLLVTVRNGNYYVVERQDWPPNGRPIAYLVPFEAVDSARMQRVNQANTGLEDLLIEEILKELGSPTPP